MSENILVDPNTADEETLAQIPGVGGEMAKRILNGRPYTSLDDLVQVNGIGPALLEKFAPYMVLSPAEAVSVGEDDVAVAGAEHTEADLEVKTPVDEEVLSTKPEISPEAELPPVEAEVLSGIDDSPLEDKSPSEQEPLTPEIKPSDDEEVFTPEKVPPAGAEATDEDTTPVEELTISEAEPPAPPTQPAYATRGQAFWMSLGCSSVAFILALVIAIGLLAGLNSGNLVFATPVQVSKLTLEVERIDSEIQGIEQDLDGLRSRVNNLESLTSRMDEVEQTTKDLGTQVTSVTSQVEEMDQDVQALATDVETLKAESARYQDFFNGLRELLSRVIPTEEGSDEQQPK
jgi:outer membrane murein-binding lipoprotein Lpp